jgi:hypothetical protein
MGSGRTDSEMLVFPKPVLILLCVAASCVGVFSHEDEGYHQELLFFYGT